MAIRINAIEMAAALERGSSDLKFLMAREEIAEEIQAKFYHVGITSMAKFATIAENEAELKTLLKDSFELDASTDIAARVKVASIVVAFKAAQARTEKVAEIEGELQTKRLQKPLSAHEYQSMRLAWEAKFWPLDDSQTPGRSYIEKRSDDLEGGDWRAEPLTSVLSRDEDQTEGFISFWDASGQLQLKRGGTSVPEPGNSEALRKRLKLMGVGLMWLGLKHTNRPQLQGITPQDIEDYLSYLLGEHVWQLAGRSAEGSTVALPSWNQLLTYEYAIRKKTYHDMLNGCTFKQALKDSYRDPVTKERFFTTPLAMASSNRRPLAFNDGAQQLQGNHAKGKGKGVKQSKGKGKGKGKKGKGQKLQKGKHNYCYAFNNSWERCRNKGCTFDHLCLKCGGKHPVYQCTNTEQPASETQGNE